MGLLKKLFARKPFVLDIDDWEMGFFIASFKDINNTIAKKIFFILKEPVRFFCNPDKSFIWFFIMERLVKRASRVTVSNSFLQKRFGGTIIYHFRDTDFLNPERFDSDAIKQKLNINSSTDYNVFWHSAATQRPGRLN